jgi:hypothetical protein
VQLQRIPLHEQVCAKFDAVAAKFLTTKPPAEAASRRPDGDPDGGRVREGALGHDSDTRSEM